MKHEKINLDDKIFRFIYVESMRDAVIQLAYKGEKKCLEKSDVLDAVKGEIESLIDKVLNDGYISQDEYDEDFLNATINICRLINEKVKNDQFAFGNAQKLVNIMVKYFYVSSYKDKNAKRKFRFCHCPMDQQLLNDVWGQRANLDDPKELGKRESFLKSWGNEDFEEDKSGKKTYPARYTLFQRAVRCLAEKMDVTSLEYDYYVW